MPILTAALEVAANLLVQADHIRADHPEVAAELEAGSRKLLDAVPSLSVAQVADLLEQSRPTIYEWIKAGYLLTEEAARRGVRVSPESLLVLIPILHEWQDQGRVGRPSRLLQEWLDGALERGERRRAFAVRRRAGRTDLQPPRRATAPTAAVPLVVSR